MPDGSGTTGSAACWESTLATRPVCDCAFTGVSAWRTGDRTQEIASWSPTSFT